jgi:hypothetical protein
VAQELEQAVPGWRAELRGQMQALAEGNGMPQVLARWQRAEELLHELDHNEDLAGRVQRLAVFQQRLQEALAVEVHRRAEEIEASAQAQATARNQELQELATQIAEKQQQRDKLDADIAERVRELEQEGGRLGEAARAVNRAREHLAGELAGLATLLQQVGVPAVPAARSFGSRQESEGLPPASGLPLLQGPAIEQRSDFVRSRLYPALAELESECRLSHADRLHTTLLACPWVLVPSPRWAEAYETALGGSGRQLVLPVQASWAGFTDAWSSEMEEFWRQAAGDLSRIFLVVFHEINRSLPQVWASAWLALLDGHRPTLPADPPVHWPVNLRVLATVARDDAVFALHDSLLARWAAPVDLGVSGGRNDPPPGTLQEGHVPAATWLRWAGRPVQQPLHGGRAASVEQLARLLGDIGEPMLAILRRALLEDYPRSYFGGAARERA